MLLRQRGRLLVAAALLALACSAFRRWRRHLAGRAFTAYLASMTSPDRDCAKIEGRLRKEAAELVAGLTVVEAEARLPPELDLVLSGGGFKNCYSAGVAMAMQLVHAKTGRGRVRRLAGASAGAQVAAGILGDAYGPMLVWCMSVAQTLKDYPLAQPFPMWRHFWPSLARALYAQEEEGEEDEDNKEEEEEEDDDEDRDGGETKDGEVTLAATGRTGGRGLPDGVLHISITRLDGGILGRVGRFLFGDPTSSSSSSSSSSEFPTRCPPSHAGWNNSPLWNTMVSSFAGADDLGEAMLSSGAIPWVLCESAARQFRGHWVVDGGATINTPVFRDAVRPQMVIRFSHLPPELKRVVYFTDEEMIGLVERGIRDLVSFVRKGPEAAPNLTIILHDTSS